MPMSRWRTSGSVSRRCSTHRRLPGPSPRSSRVPVRISGSPTWRWMMAVRTIEVRERVMAKNDEIAATVRRQLHEAGIAALNLVSSPGSGKTTLLERTLDALGDELRISIVTGDVQTQNDADRLAQRTPRLVQAVVTNGACHLDARQVQTALAAIDLGETDLLFIENV